MNKKSPPKDTSSIKKDLEQNAELYHTIINLAPEVIYSISPDGKFKSLSPAFETITGWKVTKWLGKTFDKLVHPEDLPLAVEKFKLTLSGKSSGPYELRILTKSGEYICGEFASSPIYENRKVVGKIGMGRNITERKAAEESSQKLAAIVEFSDDAIFSKTLDGIVTSWNRGAKKLYSYKKEDIIGKPVTTFIPDDRIDEFAEIMEVIKMGEAIDHLETERITKDQRRIDVSVTISPLFDSLGNIIGASTITRDISAIKELERRKDAFIGMASHELKTPITTVKAFVQVLQKRLEQFPDEQVKRYLAKTDEQVDKLADLVSNLLDLSKIQAGKLELHKEDLKLSQLITETIENIQGFTNNHKIIVKGTAEQKIVGDKDRLSQVLINLLNNAIKYSPESDKVIVKVLPDTNKITVAIQDFGIGISKAHQKKIFDRFYRASGASEKTFPGLGIGLYISSELITRHGGNIWVESTKSKGSTFFFTLPLK